MTLPLTVKQEELWRYIKSCKRSPSYDELTVAMKTGRGNLHRMIDALRDRGFVTYIPRHARSLVALDPYDGLAGFKTSELMAELENRGILLSMAHA